MELLNGTPRQMRGLRAGYTLVELMMTLAVIATILVGLGGVLVSSHNAYTEMLASSSIDETGCRTLDRLVWELRYAQADTLALSPATNARTITYRKVQGWAGTGATLSAVQTVTFSAGKVQLNGVAIADGVQDLFFNLNGNTLSAALDMQKTVNVSGASHVLSRRFEVQIVL